MKRELWIDAFKAFLALGVLHAHVIGQFGHESVVTDSVIVCYFKVFRVPAFYFIAAFLFSMQIGRQIGTSRLKNDADSPVSLKSRWNKVMEIIKTKFCQLIIPAVFFMLLTDFSEGWNDFLSKGIFVHYFLPSLFYMFVCYIFMYVWMSNLSRPAFIAILIFWAALSKLAAVIFVPGFNKLGFLNINNFLDGNMFFVMGVICQLYYKEITPVLRKFPVTLLLGAIYSWLYFKTQNWAHPLDQEYDVLYYQIICPVLGVLFLFSAFLWLMKFIKPTNVAGKVSFYLGQRTLPLYVMQYMMFGVVYFVLETFSIEWMGNVHVSIVILYVSTLVLVLLTHDVICRIPLVNKYLFGRNKKLKKSIM